MQINDKKIRFKPLFKQIIKLRENIQTRQKVLKFKKKKWETFLTFYKKKLKNYKKFKPLDQLKYFVTRYGTKKTGYKKRFRDNLFASKSLRLFYGHLSEIFLKKTIDKIKNKKNPNLDKRILLLDLLEKRLDNTLFRAKFVTSLREASQLITHGKIFVNNKPIKIKSYLLKSGDIITLNHNVLKQYSINLVKLKKVSPWPLPSKHLIINYKTMQILVFKDINNNLSSTSFPFYLRLSKILTQYSNQ